MKRPAWHAVTLAVSIIGCGSETHAPKPAEVGALPAGIAARVADEDIATELVASVAVAQGISPAAARERLVSGALFAVHARTVLAGTGFAAAAERSAVARALSEQIRSEAQAKGPPTDAEVDEVTELRWLDFARPAMVRTSHVVVLDDAPTKAAKTRQVAERMREAAVGISDPDEFEKKTKAVDREGLEIKVEHLPPVAADGRIGDPRQPPGAEVQRFEVAYAQAANAVAEVPGLTGLVETSYGIHVILVLERVPEKRVPLEDRRLIMTREIVDRRARKQHQSILETVNKSTPVMIDRGANELLGLVQVGK